VDTTPLDTFGEHCWKYSTPHLSVLLISVFVKPKNDNSTMDALVKYLKARFSRSAYKITKEHQLTAANGFVPKTPASPAVTCDILVRGPRYNAIIDITITFISVPDNLASAGQFSINNANARKHKHLEEHLQLRPKDFITPLTFDSTVGNTRTSTSF
jgi:ribosomal protein S15P/S13E